MRIIAIAGTVVCAALSGSGLLRGGTASRSLPSPGHRPQLTEPSGVRFLIHQLDDRRFEVRREADGILRQMPTTVVPLLEAELKTRPSLEVTRRLESIIQDLSRIPWRTNLTAAAAEARRTGKPLFVFSADRPFADPSIPMAATFADRELVGSLREKFVPVWHVQAPGRVSRIVQIVLLGNDSEKIQRAFWPAENARSYFCTPDGRILHYVEGHRNVEDFRDEVRHARQLARRFGVLSEEEGIANARSALMIRDSSAAQRRHSFQVNDENLGIAMPVTDLIGQPLAPILDRLRAVMVQLRNGC